MLELALVTVSTIIAFVVRRRRGNYSVLLSYGIKLKITITDLICEIIILYMSDNVIGK